MSMDKDTAKSWYQKLVATIPELALKGATTPYTSLNGNMYSYLGDNGLALRLPTDARTVFLATYVTTLYVSHGVTQKEYVTVPDTLLEKTAELQQYFAASFEYAKTLRPKPTTKRKR